VELWYQCHDLHYQDCFQEDWYMLVWMVCQCYYADPRAARPTQTTGVNNVRVELWRETNSTPGLQTTGGGIDTYIRRTTTDADGYYLFERLQPGDNYYVHIRRWNFNAVRRQGGQHYHY